MTENTNPSGSFHDPANPEQTPTQNQNPTSDFEQQNTNGTSNTNLSAGADINPTQAPPANPMPSATSLGSDLSSSTANISEVNQFPEPTKDPSELLKTAILQNQNPTPTPTSPVNENLATATSEPVNQVQQQASSNINPTATPKENTINQELRPRALNSTNPNKRRKVFTSCLAAGGCGFVLFVAMILLAIQQTGVNGNPIAEILSIDLNSFMSFLVILINIIFGFTALLTFIAAIIGVFKASNARKDDKKAKSQGMILALVSGVLFLIVSLTWIGIYTYLNSKRTISSNQQVAEIVTTPENTTGLTAPVTIEFDATSIPFDNRRFRVLSISWDFGDGSTGTGSKISHQYKSKGNNDGRFTATLSVRKQSIQTNEESIDTYTREIFIQNEKVNAEFSTDSSEGPAPLTINFDASKSLDPDGQIVSWEWDFDGDGQYDAEGEKVEYTYEKEGEYKVTLRVVDNNNEFDLAEETITVGAVDAVTAKIEVSPEVDEYKVGETYTFSAEESSSPNGKITSYTWDFGDGSAQKTTRTATQKFTESGKYVITLAVKDEDGEEGEQELEIEVKDNDEAPKFTISSNPALNNNKITGSAPLTINFDIESATMNDLVDFQWDFDGDGKFDESAAKVSYTYTQPGAYNSSVTVTNSAGLETKSNFQVQVEKQAISARLSANPIEGNSPLAVNFDASASSYPDGKITSYEWDFGDGSPKRIDNAQVNYKYTKIGTFEATVTAIGDDNKRATATISINVRPVSLSACFTPSRVEGEAPLIVVFDPKCSAGSIANYNWDFGDGDKTRDRRPTHTFANPGTYTVTLEVTDNQNVFDTYEETILVTGEITQ